MQPYMFEPELEMEEVPRSMYISQRNFTMQTILESFCLLSLFV